ncbi:hypothetical protein [Mechercharimyces sp. CAU 1602]|uniref:hypothetical protein n=1 Tax=Mechercharimyces sp. CAU 1602 TaxID=2973933 RepID=UPI002163166F|nr:hypothetical protein [Mechercharimyces sp. CAU 1602]MCS1351669.1 hypothetical protein [Mechercharimyces sp. CAU 1602]
MGKKAYLIPLFFFVWATFDHGAWNAHSFGMPAMASFFYALSFYGYLLKWFFVLLIVLAILLDYRTLNRVRDQLPLLPSEKVVEPVSDWIMIL